MSHIWYRKRKKGEIVTHAHAGIFVGIPCLVTSTLSSWPLRITLVGAVAARTIVIWHGFEVQVEEHGEESEEEWCKDAQ